MILNQTLPIALLDPSERNYNRHSPAQLERLALSLRRFSQPRSIVVWQRPGGRYTIIAGHGITEAAKQEGWTEIRCDVLPEDTSADDALGFMVADNELSRLADPDEVALAALLEEQQHAGYAIEALGYSDDELRDLLESLGDAALGNGKRDADDPDGGGDDFDATPDEQQTRVKAGDIWQLGRHRLMCGDSTDAENVALLMQGDVGDVLATDPPYGVSYVGKTAKALTIQNDGSDGLDALLAASFAAMDTALKPGAAIYIAHPAGAQSVTFGVRFLAQGWRLHQTLVWVKDSMVLGHSDYHYRHEPILFGYKPGGGRRGRGGEGWYGDNSQTSVLEFPRPKRSAEHPTMKPTELYCYMLNNSCPPDGIVVEPFSGSGTTIIAAERCAAMQCRAWELDPSFVNVALTRWEAETGQPATLLHRESE